MSSLPHEPAIILRDFNIEANDLTSRRWLDLYRSKNYFLHKDYFLHPNPVTSSHNCSLGPVISNSTTWRKLIFFFISPNIDHPLIDQYSRWQRNSVMYISLKYITIIESAIMRALGTLWRKALYLTDFLFPLDVPPTSSHQHLNTISKSIISSRRSQLKPKDYLKRERNNPPKS